MCVVIFSTTLVCNVNHFSFLEELSKIWTKTYIVFHVKYPLFLSDFNETWNFLTDFFKNMHISNFMKNHLVGAELFNVDGQTRPTDTTSS